MTASSNSLDKIGGLALVGAGKMGGAMLEGWLALGLDPRKRLDLRSAIRRRRSSALAAQRRRRSIRPRTPPASPSVVILAVKPQIAAEVMPSVAALAGARHAGALGHGRQDAGFPAGAPCPSAAIVRAMPNTPAAIGRGITVLVPNAKVTPAQRAIATDLLAATGKVEWIDDEALMDAVTAVSGSGPAYVFLLAEALAQAGIAAGLAERACRKARARNRRRLRRVAASLAARSRDIA